MLIVGDSAIWILMLGLIVVLCLYWAIKTIVSLFTGG